MTRHLLDTDVCIYLMNRRPGFEKIVRRIDGRHYGEILVSTVTLAELAYGASNSARPEANRSAIGLFLARFEALPFDEAAAGAYGVVRSTLEARGMPIGPLDTLIASQAIAADAVLVTNNLREFERVPGLRVESWL